MRQIIISLIKIYQRLLGPLWHGLMGPSAGCRFTPTCSQYAIDAVELYGVRRGVWMALKRVGRCHPGCPGGYDPVKKD